MDTIDFGEMYAFTAIDIYTREAQVILRPSLTARDGAKALNSIMKYFGRCHIIQTDGGSEFGAEFTRLATAYATHHRVARPYRQNEQAFIERFNRTVRQECLGWLKYKILQINILQDQVHHWLDYYHLVRPSMAFQPMRPPRSHNNGLSHLT